MAVVGGGWAGVEAAVEAHGGLQVLVNNAGAAHQAKVAETSDQDWDILIETNLSRNVQTRVVARSADHPVRRYFDAGLNVTLCTDSWLMSGTTLSHEYWLAHAELGFTREEIDRMILNAFASSFLPWPTRQTLLAEVGAELGALR